MISKPLDLITDQDILALVEAGAAESAVLEYKSQLPGNSDGDKIRFIAEVIAFANTRGGLLIVGIEDVEGSPQSISGIGDVDVDAEILRLDQILRSGASPRLQFSIKPIAVGDLSVLVVEVPKSWTGPHLISFKDHSKFYGRNSAGKYPMDVFEIRDAFLSSEAIPARARQFRLDRAKKINERHELPIELYERSVLAIHLVPLASFGPGGAGIIDTDTLNNSMLRPPGSRGWNNRLNLDGKVNYSGRVGEPSLSYVQLFRNGSIEAAASVGYPDENGSIRISGSLVESYLKEGLESYLDFYSKQNVPGPYYCFITLLDVLGAQIGLDTVSLRLGEPPTSDRSIVLLPELVIEGEVEDLMKALRPTIDFIWNAFGMSQSPNFDADGNWAPRR